MGVGLEGWHGETDGCDEVGDDAEAHVEVVLELGSYAHIHSPLERDCESKVRQGDANH